MTTDPATNGIASETLPPTHGFAQYVADELSGIRFIDGKIVEIDAVVSAEEPDLVAVTSTIRNYHGTDRVEHWRLWVTSLPGDDNAAPEPEPAVAGIGAIDEPPDQAA